MNINKQPATDPYTPPEEFQTNAGVDAFFQEHYANLISFLETAPQEVTHQDVLNKLTEYNSGRIKIGDLRLIQQKPEKFYKKEFVINGIPYTLYADKENDILLYGFPGE